eukprot:CAMPEP_0115639846 /NCGR_PEP_ID=MMETSP0272-20121206/35473_1 /TAXON_ID=71861 /ORGANISM="Scrippsiella trochoidea, Strain CCMP3099" /LENGTH=301 /DNA_ID=CAMNT_0003077051 /DNA_START=112 /DNA_END=1013 /DNA_ORIENTATION=-
MSAASGASMEFLSREELVHKVHELQQGLSELALKELASHREEMAHREQALVRREAEVARREAAVAAREEACVRRGSHGGSNIAAAAAAAALAKGHHMADAGSPGLTQALMTPTPTRAMGGLDTAGNHGGNGMVGAGCGGDPLASPAPPLPLASDSVASTTSSPCREEPIPPPQKQPPHQHQPWRPAQLQGTTSPQLGSPRHSTTSSNGASSAGATGGRSGTTSSASGGVVMASPPPPPARRLSGPNQGSASKLKAMFEQRAAEQQQQQQPQQLRQNSQPFQQQLQQQQQQQPQGRVSCGST